MNNTKEYIVLFRRPQMSALYKPFGYTCTAIDGLRAEEQCINKFPDANVIWVYQGESYKSAMDEFNASLNQDFDDWKA